jgi:hypothetical protein
MRKRNVRNERVAQRERILDGPIDLKNDDEASALAKLRPWLESVRTRPRMTQLCDLLLDLLDRGNIGFREVESDGKVECRFVAENTSSEAEDLVAWMDDPVGWAIGRLFAIGRLGFLPVISKQGKDLAFVVVDPSIPWGLTPEAPEQWSFVADRDQAA